MKNKDICEALVLLGYETGWVVRGDEISGIEWIEQPSTIPTEAQILDAVASLDNLKNQREEKRQALLIRLGITDDEARMLLG
jgi:hypothetical protein